MSRGLGDVYKRQFSLRSEIGAVEIPEYHLLQTLPYLLVLIGGVAGINVFVVLLTGIFSGAVIMLATGATHPTELLGNMGSGASGMFETIMVTILVSAMCGLIREYGGFEALLGFIKRIFHGQRGGQLGIGLLVGATLGGNLTPIGASANIAAIGILQKEGYEVKATDFLKIGVPFTLLAVLTGYLYCWFVWA